MVLQIFSAISDISFEFDFQIILTTEVWFYLHNCSDLKHLMSSLQMFTPLICLMSLIIKFLRDAFHFGVWTRFLIWNHVMQRDHPDLHRQYDLEVWSFDMFSNIAICTWRPVDSCFLHCMSLKYPGKVILIPAPLLRTKGTGCSLRRLQLPVTAGQWHPLRCCASPLFHRRLQH